MNPKQVTSLFALCGSLGLLAACSTEPESHLVTAPPPAAPLASATQAVVTTQPQQVVVAQGQQVVTAYPAPANSFVVMQAPPALQPEAVPAQPSSQHVWVAGYWTWQNNRYAWMAGHWEVPPASATRWVNPRTDREGGAYRFYEGHWE